MRLEKLDARFMHNGDPDTVIIPAGSKVKLKWQRPEAATWHFVCPYQTVVQDYTLGHLRLASKLVIDGNFAYTHMQDNPGTVRVHQGFEHRVNIVALTSWGDQYTFDLWKVIE